MVIVLDNSQLKDKMSKKFNITNKKRKVDYSTLSYLSNETKTTFRLNIRL